KWLSRGMQAGTSIYRPRAAGSPEQARYILAGVLRSCRKQLQALRPRESDSTWSGYLDSKSIYSPTQLAEKETFVREALDLMGAGRVLDIGANEGRYSLLAAAQGCPVVAIDFDPVVAGTIWRKAHAEKLDVLPLVVDLARPTPATGWRNRE